MTAKCARCLALVLYFLLATVGTLNAATFQVNIVGTTFSPNQLTIQPGDSVTWSSSGGLSHNVAADDGSFRCAQGCDGMGGNGDFSSSPFEFTLTFNDPGSIPYHCEVHGGPGGVGMAGTITVEGSTSTNPGSVAFSQPNFGVGEGAGSRTVTVQRTGGSDGAVSVDYATSDGSASSGSDYQSTSGTLNWGDGESGEKMFSVTVIDDSTDENNETVNLALSNPTGGVTLGSQSTATVTIQDNDSAGSPGSLSFEETSYSVNEGAGSVTLQVDRSGGSSGSVSIDYETVEGSASEGADYLGDSGTLDWSDGDSSAKSFDVSIINDSEAENSESFGVTLSNPSGGASIGDNGTATVTIPTNDQPIEPCEADEFTACLNVDGRFQAEVTFFDGTNTGQGHVIDIGLRDSTLFWFFDPNNAEMLVKVLNACIPALGNTYFVFSAATTNVEFTLTITDTQTGEVKVYDNTLGVAALPVQDTSAFATCP